MEENKKILILDNSGLSFTGNELDGKVLRGTETSLILLAEQFVKKKSDVFFVTNTHKEEKVNGVNYINYNVCDME